MARHSQPADGPQENLSYSEMAPRDVETVIRSEKSEEARCQRKIQNVESQLHRQPANGEPVNPTSTMQVSNVQLSWHGGRLCNAMPDQAFASDEASCARRVAVKHLEEPPGPKEGRL